MLSYIKRKLSESDGGVSSSATVTSSCGGNSGSGISASGSTSSGSISSGGRGNSADELVRKTSQMSMDDEAIAFGEDALLHELGYRNATDLQETIYGLMIFTLLPSTNYVTLTYHRSVTRHSRSGEAVHAGGSQCNLRGRDLRDAPTRSNVSVVGYPSP